MSEKKAYTIPPFLKLPLLLKEGRNENIIHHTTSETENVIEPPTPKNQTEKLINP